MWKFVLSGAALFVALGNAATAQEFQVEVQNISTEMGSVMVQRGTQMLPLTDVSLVYANDIITTSSKGFVTLSHNGCEVALYGDNYYVIEETSFCNTKAFALDCACEGGLLPAPDTVIAAPHTIATPPAPAAPAPTKVAVVSPADPVIAATGSEPRAGLLFGIATAAAVGLAAASSGSGSGGATTAASPG